jgi:hypothetical protein
VCVHASFSFWLIGGVTAGCLWLPASGRHKDNKWSLTWAAFKQFKLHAHFNLRIYRICEGESLLRDFVPAHIDVVACSPPVHFWRPPAEQHGLLDSLDRIEGERLNIIDEGGDDGGENAQPPMPEQPDRGCGGVLADAFPLDFQLLVDDLGADDGSTSDPPFSGDSILVPEEAYLFEPTPPPSPRPEPPPGAPESESGLDDPNPAPVIPVPVGPAAPAADIGIGVPGAALPPPVPLGGGHGKAKGKGKFGDAWTRVQVGDFGFIVYDDGKRTIPHRNPTLNAHCTCEHGLCRVNRTCIRGVHQAGRGRPLGFLICWLRAGKGATCANRAAHHSLSTRPMQLAEEISFAKRSAAREWASGIPEFAPFFAAERARFPGEGPEPADVP